jgi:hypothetical protein
MKKLIIFVICVCLECIISSSCSIQQSFIKETLEPHEEAKEIAPIYTSDDHKISLGFSPKMLIIMAGIVLGRMVMDKRFFSRTVAIDYPKAIGIQLKDLDKKVSRSNRFDHELTVADSIIPPGVVNAHLVKLNREQLL